MNKTRGPQKNSPYLIWVTGILIALTVSFVTSAILSAFYLNGFLNEKSAAWLIAILQLLSVLAGAFIAGKRKGNKYMLSSAIVGAGYYLALVASTLLLFDSSFDRLGIGTLMSGLGAVIASLLCLGSTSKSKRKRRRL